MKSDQLFFVVLFLLFSISIHAQFAERSFAQAVVLEAKQDVNRMWNVPEGVSIIGVELWGAGGTGGVKGGGQGGGYVRAIILLRPKDTLHYFVGIANTVDVNMRNTFLFSSAVRLTAVGGADNGENNKGNYILPIKNDSLPFAIGIHGGFSRVTRATEFSYRDSAHLIKTIHGDTGGNGGNTTDTYGAGGFHVLTYNPDAEVIVAKVLDNARAGNGNIPGGGGGGGMQFASNMQQVIVSGGSGGNGKIIVRY